MTFINTSLSVGLLLTFHRPFAEPPHSNIQYGQRVHTLGEIRTRSSNQWAANEFGWL